MTENTFAANITAKITTNTIAKTSVKVAVKITAKIAAETGSAVFVAAVPGPETAVPPGIAAGPPPLFHAQVKIQRGDVAVV